MSNAVPAYPNQYGQPNTAPLGQAQQPVQQQPMQQQPVQQPPPQQYAEPPDPAPPSMRDDDNPSIKELRIYSHSKLIFWWPVWVMGYILAAMTYWQGDDYEIANTVERYHPSSNLGVFYFLTLFMVILITNVSVRGLASGIVILGGAFIALLFAYFSLWDDILGWMGNLRIHMNMGAYFWFSTLLMLLWIGAVFIIDHMSYWEVKPGQITLVTVLGAGSRTYDTHGMVLEKHREDIFRHWVLGLGSGDLIIHTSGATKERIEVLNVAFVGTKIETMQRLISEDPHADH